MFIELCAKSSSQCFVEIGGWNFHYILWGRFFVPVSHMGIDQQPHCSCLPWSLSSPPDPELLHRHRWNSQSHPMLPAQRQARAWVARSPKAHTCTWPCRWLSAIFAFISLTQLLCFLWHMVLEWTRTRKKQNCSKRPYYSNQESPSCTVC